MGRAPAKRETSQQRGCRMIVRQFLHWVRTAPAGERAEATGALARAYLYSDLAPDDRDAAEGAMITLVDDPSPLVRGRSPTRLPAARTRRTRSSMRSASDHRDIAAVVLARSPLFIDAELVDLVAIGDVRAAVRHRGARAGAVRRRSRDRRGRRAGSLPHRHREPLRRHRADLDCAHRRAVRPSRRHPRGAVRAARPAAHGAPDAGADAVRRARRFRHRPRLARARPRPAGGARGLREGDRHHRGRSAPTTIPAR